MRLVVTPERMRELTLDQLIELEAMQFGENVRLRAVRDLVAHFMVGEAGELAGEYLPPEAARRDLGRLTVPELEEVTREFRKSMRDGLVPLASDGS